MSESFRSSSSAAKKPGPTMNRSAPEWGFQKFITEEVDKKGEDEEGETLEKNGATSFINGCSEGNRNNNVPVDMDEYRSFLKNKLNLASAAVATSRASFLKHHDSADSGFKSNTPQVHSGSKAISKGAGDKDVNEPVGFPSFLSGQNKVRPSSKEDELVGENRDPADAKRVRRMLSNRESATHSWRRKQIDLCKLEMKVAQLRVKKANYLKQLTDLSQRYINASIENRVLEANVETLEAKVKMSEELFESVYGFKVSYDSTEIATMLSSFYGSLSDTSTDAAVSGTDNDLSDTSSDENI